MGEGSAEGSNPQPASEQTTSGTNSEPQKTTSPNPEKTVNGPSDADGESEAIYNKITKRTRNSILASVFLAIFLSALDQNVVIVAIPKIVVQFGHPELLSWILAAYILTSSATMALYGRFSDVYGRRPVFLFAVGVFLVGSTLSAAATSIWMLIIARGIQGVGGGGLMSIGMIIVGDVVPPRERPVWLSIISLCFAASSVIGPLLGGFFTDYLSWRWVFWINLPLAGAAIIVTFFALKLQVPTKKLALDVGGALLICAAAGSTVLFVSWGGQDGGYPWNSGVIIGLIIASILLYIGFVVQELRHPLPIINVNLFREWNFAVIMIMMFFTGMLMLGAFAYLPLYFQNVQKDSATISGLKLLPLILGFMVSGGVATGVMTKTGKFRVLLPIGAVFSAIGLGLPISLSPSTNYWLLAFYLLLMGLGIGLLFPVTTTVVQNALPPAEMANGLSSLTFFQTMGGAVGVAIMGAVLSGQSTSRVKETFDFADALCFGLDWVFVVSTALAMIVLIFSFLLKPMEIFKRQGDFPAMV